MTKSILQVILSVALTPVGVLAAHAPPSAAPPAAPVSAGTAGTGGRAAPAAAIVRADGDWREARWGMSLEQVLAAFPGEAFPLDPPLKLADGNVVAAGIEKFEVGAQPFRVRFIFEGGKLALVSLRTPPESPARPEVYVELQKLLADRLGGPGESTADDEFVDMRQTRWKAGRSTVDLKYVPGVVVILYHPS
jgi:hypothetical protein